MHGFSHVARVRAAVTAFLDAADGLRNVNHEYVNAGMDAKVTDDVMIEAFGSQTVEEQEVPVVTAAEFQTAISSAQAFLTLLDQGHATNFYKLK